MAAAVAIFFWFISLPVLGIYLYHRWRKNNPKKEKVKISKRGQKAIENLEIELNKLKSDDKYKMKKCPYCKCLNEWHHQECIYCSTSLD